MQRKHIVIIDWEDRGVEDSDEIVIFADSAAQAVQKAKEKWRLTITAEWPQCRIVEAKVLTRRAAHQFA